MRSRWLHDLIPFLIIDLVVAKRAMAMGMMMVVAADDLRAVQDMLFVMVDGWALIIGTWPAGSEGIIAP